MEEQVQKRKADAAEVFDPKEKIRLLLVDDQEAILRSLRRTFRGEPYEVHTALGGEEALAIIDKQDIDVVISDMRMPGMDGLELLKQIRRLYPNIVRIVLSGYADLESVIDVINEAEIFSYVNKPWDEMDLKFKVRNAAEKRYLKFVIAQSEKKKKMELEEKVKDRTVQLLEAKHQLEDSYKKLEESYQGAVRMIAYFAEQGMPHLGKHAENVSKLASRFTNYLGIDGKEASDTVTAARLHDIGLCVLDDEVVATPESELTGKAKKLFQKHTILGENTLMGLPVMSNVAKMIRHHHEKYNGGGYPDGLKGELIPLGARIIKIVNDYDTMTDKHRGGKYYSADEALSIIRENRLGQYDAKLAKSFHVMMSSGGSEGHLDSGHVWAVKTGNLKPGMVLYENLISKDGVLLMTAGQSLSSTLIANLKRIEGFDEQEFTLYVRTEDEARVQ